LSRRHPVRRDRPCVAYRIRMAGWFYGVNRQHPHMSRSVKLDVVHGREQDASFQVLERGPEFDATYSGLAIARIDGILGRHGPSWAKRPTFRVIANALACHEHRRRRATSMSLGAVRLQCSCSLIMTNRGASVPRIPIFSPRDRKSTKSVCQRHLSAG
jgi:hypothetical protein